MSLFNDDDGAERQKNRKKKIVFLEQNRTDKSRQLFLVKLQNCHLLQSVLKSKIQIESDDDDDDDEHSESETIIDDSSGNQVLSIVT